MDTFIRAAREAGYSEILVRVTAEIFEPWIRKQPLSMGTRLYRDLGIGNEDLDEMVFALWKRVFSSDITQREADRFSKLEVVEDIMRVIQQALVQRNRDG